MPPLLPGKKRTGTKANLFQAQYLVDGNTNWLHFMHLEAFSLHWKLLFIFPFLQSILLHYPKYPSYPRVTTIQTKSLHFIKKCFTWIIIFMATISFKYPEKLKFWFWFPRLILQQMEKHHKLCHLNIDQMYLLHPILIKRNVWQSLERIDLLELKVRLPLLFFPP